MAVENAGAGAGKPVFAEQSTLVVEGDMRPPGKKRVLPRPLIVMAWQDSALRGPGGRVWKDRPVALRAGS